MFRTRKDNDHNKSILIKQGELKIISSGLKYYIYENEDGSTTEIGELVVGSPTIINQIPLSIDAEGNPYNNGQGWKTGYRINSSGAETTADGMKVTGFISARAGDTIYMQGIKFVTVCYLM